MPSLKWVISWVLALAATCAVAEPLDINAADADQIAKAMVGVGKVKADAIVQDRDKNGKFKSIDDMTRVKGIKSNLIDKNRDKITVGQSDAPPAPDLAKQ